MTWRFDPATRDFGVTYTPAIVQPGEPYWRIVQAHGPMDIGGNHCLYVDVWGERGDRVVGIPVVFFWAGEEDMRRTELKPGEPQAVNLPMYASGNSYGVRVSHAGMPSDSMFGFGLPQFKPHHSFRVIFQRAIGQSSTAPTPPRPPGNAPGEPGTQRRIDEALRLMDLACKELEAIK